MNDIELKQRITTVLNGFSKGNLRENGIALLNALGYHGNRQVILAPNTFSGLAELSPKLAGMNQAKALVPDWLSVDILFQLTGEDIRDLAQGHFIFEDAHRIDDQIIESYLFMAIELRQAEYSRSKLADLTREINRHFAIPVMILIKHGSNLTFSIINRRLNRREESKDVLEKVTLIKGITTASPLRAHIEILFDLSLFQLQKMVACQNFVELHCGWQKTLDTSELNKKFYREVASWYFWAVKKVEYPAGTIADVETRNATNVIRLITRLIFVWFIKEKGLVPDELFNLRALKDLLQFNDARNSTFYKAILQNLFFATLNTEMGVERRFRGKNKNPNGLDGHHGISTVYRYQDYFTNPDEALRLFAGIPFLNGGLFECLDKREEKIIVDGFSDDPRNQPVVPDELFFGDERQVNMNEVYGDTRHSRENVRGLIQIFNSYKFTIEENTPLDEEIALDPELLGKVFENLLAAYNPETGTTARKQTGSFYTPREIVNYMVDESLIAYLETMLEGALDLQPRLRQLLAYNQEPHAFTPEETRHLIAAIDAIKVLDPACGSGAFPMGALLKLVFILSKLDHGNHQWKQRQVDKAAELPDAIVRERVMVDIEKSFTENELDYGRKLYLIENCIYGVDIQPIAVQIAKLRFFISLVVEQKTDLAKPNLGIRPLPNLETKFVAANTLIGIEKPQQLMFRNPEIDTKEKQLKEVRDALFTARTPATKRKYRESDKLLRNEIAGLLQNDGWGSAVAAQLAGWDPYDQNTSASFFDPEWMFGIQGGFDIIIANPPYVGHKGGQKGFFREMKQTSLGKRFNNERMDLFYYFFHKAIDIGKQSSIIIFITTNYYPTADSAVKLRTDFKNRVTIRKLINFGEVTIFESATGQHNLITMLSKSKTNTTCEITSTNRNSSISQEVLISILGKKDKLTTYNSLSQEVLFEGPSNYIRMTISNNHHNSEIPQNIFTKMLTNSTELGALCKVSQGIVTGIDKITKKHLERFPNLDIRDGEGCYVVEDSIAKLLNDYSVIKPWFKNSDISKYWTNTRNSLWVIHATTNIDLVEHERIFNHLSKFVEIIKSRNYESGELSKALREGKWWALSSARRDFDFTEAKIVSPQRNTSNTFGYNEVPWYASADVYFITKKLSMRIPVMSSTESGPCRPVAERSDAG